MYFCSMKNGQGIYGSEISDYQENHFLKPLWATHPSIFDNCRIAMGHLPMLPFLLSNANGKPSHDNFPFVGWQWVTFPFLFSICRKTMENLPIEVLQLSNTNGKVSDSSLTTRKPYKDNFVFALHNVQYSMFIIALNGKSQVAEVAAIASRLDTLLSKKWSKSDEYLTDAISEFHVLSVRMTESMSHRVQSDYAEHDRIRRDCLRSLFMFLRSFNKSPQSEARDNALAVLEVFNRYGMRMLKKGVDGLTGLIDALLADLADKEMQDAIGHVPGLNERIEALRVAANNFNTSRLIYQQHRSEQSNKEKTKELKLAIENRINTVFLPYFAIKSKCEGGEFTDLYQYLVEMVTEANSIVKLRKEMAKARRERMNRKESA